MQDIINQLEDIIQEMHDINSHGSHPPQAFEAVDKLADLKHELERYV